MGRLLLIFVALPAVELGLLIEVGSRIGTVATLAIILTTGVVGASLARRQGLSVLAEFQRETAAGRLPAGTLVDGVVILIAAALLITPGILTDTVGFLCLVPAFRRVVKRALVRRLERAAREGSVHVFVQGFATPPPPGEADEWGERVEKEVRDLRSGRNAL